MSGAVDTATLILAAIEARLLDVHVSLPVVVESYDPETGTVEVVPLLKRVLEDDDGKPVTEELPKLPPMPVMWSRSSKFTAGTFPLEAGDTGMAVFNEVPIWQWLSTPAAARDVQQSPGETRRHTLSGGVFVPGLYNAARREAGAVAGRLVVGRIGGTTLQVPETGAAEVKGSGTTSPVVTVEKLVAAVGTLLAAGIGATGTAAFAAALSAWEGATEDEAGDTLLGATKLKAE